MIMVMYFWLRLISAYEAKAKALGMSKYKDATQVEGFGTELILFKRADLASDNWWYRANIPGVRGYIRRSTKETELVIAKRVAATAYHNLLGQKSAGLKLGKKKVGEIVQKWFQHLEARM